MVRDDRIEAYVIAIRKQEFKNYIDYIMNPYNSAEFRMHALCTLIASSATQAGPKDDANLAELLQIWNEMVGKFWYPLVYMKKRREEELLGLRTSTDPGSNALSTRSR